VISRVQILVALAVCFSVCAAAQQGAASQEALQQTPASAPSQSPPILIPRSHDERELQYQARQRVILNVQVTDANGKMVEGLGQNDFSLIDDSRVATIANVRQAAGAASRENVHVLLVLDAVSSSLRTIAALRKEVEKYFTQNRDRLPHPISLVLVSASGIVVDPPSQDADVLIAELNQFTQGVRVMDCSKPAGQPMEDASGGTITPMNRSDSLNSLHSGDGTATGGETAAQFHAADCKENQYVSSMGSLTRLVKGQLDQPGRAIMIWLGPGWPLLSGPGFGPETPAMRRTRFDRLVNLSAYLLRAQVTLDGVGLPDQSGHAEPASQALKATAPRTAGEAGPADVALPTLVRQTGGRIFESSKDVAGEIAACVEDGDAYYVVSFDAAAEAAGGLGQYHSLEIKVNHPGVTARTNSAYFAQP